MTQIVHALIALAYALAGVVTAGVLVRLGGWDAVAAWGVGAVLIVGGVQAHVFVDRRRQERRFAASLRALGHAQAHIVDELTTARRARRQLEQDLHEMAEGMARALRTETARLDDAIVAMNRRVDIGPPPEGTGRRDVTGATRSVDASLNAEDVRAAIADGRVELVAQPIVTLPQRRAAHFETFSRLRTENGDIAPASSWVEAAEASGVIAELDVLTAQRALSLAKRFVDKGRPAGVFCNLSRRCLEDGASFAALMDGLKGKTGLAEHVIFEMRQHDLRIMSVTAQRNMRRLADFGFRFSLDHVRDVDLDLGALRSASVRFIKIKGDTLLDMIRAGGPLGVGDAPDVSVQDFPELLSRSGLSLIAEKVESEATVVEALEYPIPLGQGHLFGVPRPVRAEALAQAA